MMTGMAASAVVAIIAVALGYLSFGPTPASAQAGLLAQPTPHELSLSATPPLLAAQAVTDSPTLAGLASVTPTPPPAAFDFAATATQACSQFRSSFPGTPCPRSSTPTSAP
jgi:hypothetical protein